MRGSDVALLLFRELWRLRFVPFEVASRAAACSSFNLAEAWVLFNPQVQSLQLLGEPQLDVSDTTFLHGVRAETQIVLSQ